MFSRGHCAPAASLSSALTIGTIGTPLVARYGRQCSRSSLKMNTSTVTKLPSASTPCELSSCCTCAVMVGGYTIHAFRSLRRTEAELLRLQKRLKERSAILDARGNVLQRQSTVQNSSQGGKQ